MKANLKGLSGIKGLVLRHGEKVAIAIVGIAAALIIYSSLSLEPLSDQYEPADLDQKISQTRATVTQKDWDSMIEEQPDQFRIAKEVAKREFRAAPEAYEPPSRSFINPPVITPTVPRTDPVLLPVVDVYATGGTGLFAFVDQNVRKQRALEEQKKADRLAQKQQRLQEEQLRNQDQGGYGEVGRGRGRGRRDEFGPGGEMGMPIDPDHPDRRMVEYMAQPTGIPLMGDERVDHVTWACVVAKVPIKEQIKMYRDAFENARGGYNPDQGDFPRYLGYQVERAEVKPGAQLQWQSVSVRDAQPSKSWSQAFMTRKVMDQLYEIIRTDWPGQPMEIVDPRYLDPEGVLMYPLPPLVGRSWGAEVTHPDIPLNPPPIQEPIAAEQQPAVEQGEQGEESLFRDPNEQAMMRGGYGEMMGRGGYGGPMGRGGYGEMMGRGGYGYGAEMMGRGGYGEMAGRGMEGGAYPMMGRSGSGSVTSLPPGVTDWLLRFYDFTVEPGKRYKYRIRLIFHDPNRNVPDSLLDSTVLNRIRELKKTSKKAPAVRFADWSEPSATVGIPLAGNVQVAQAKAPNAKLVNDEPSTTLLVSAIDDVEGRPNQAGIEEEFHRGYVANIIDEETEVPTTDGKYIDPVESFNFRTGITVLDIRGGESISREYKTPARVLLMGPSGQLYIRNELDDLPAVEHHRMIFAKPDRRRGRGAEPGMLPGYGGERGFEGFQRGFEGGRR